MQHQAARERGATIVEFALVVMLFLFILFGIVEFGAAYNDYQSVRQGARAGAREGVVGDFGGDNSCTTVPAGLNSDTLDADRLSDARELVCLTKDAVGLDDEDTRVRFEIVNTETDTAADTLRVCVQHEIESLTGLLARFVDGRDLTTRVEMRFERDSSFRPADSGARDDFFAGEDAPSGSDWDWC